MKSKKVFKNVNLYLADLATSFNSNSHVSNAESMRKYMKDVSDFYGIKTPLRRELIREHLSSHERPPYNKLNELIKKCWSHPFREMQYFGMEITMKYKNEWDISDLGLFEYMIKNKSWWDTVDYIAANIIGKYFNRFPEQTSSKASSWNKSENIWLIRTSIIFQLKYKTNTNTDMLFRFIENQKDSKEFFIRKAIGWALRELSKTEKAQVKKFISSVNLSNLSMREAQKYL